MNLNLPNLLSLLRMGLIPLFVISVLEGRPGRALIVFVVAGLTDMLDGFIARFFDQMSVLGAYLDPLADKLLLTTAYVMLTIPADGDRMLIPVWVTVLVIARDVLIMLLALIFYLVGGITSFPPTVVSKVNTAAQILLAAIVLGDMAFALGLADIRTILIYVVGVSTVLSAAVYLYEWIRHMSTDSIGEGNETR